MKPGSVRLAGVAAGVLMAALALVYLGELSRRADRTMAAWRTAADDVERATTDQEGTRLVLRFDRSKSPGGLVSGWSGLEPGVGTWSLGDEAILKLRLPPGTARVLITLTPFLAPDLPAQRVTVTAQGRVLAQWALAHPEPRALELTVPGDLRDSEGAVTLVLKLPDADAPARRTPGATDSRALAVKLTRIEAEVGAPPSSSGSPAGAVPAAE